MGEFKKCVLILSTLLILAVVLFGCGYGTRHIFFLSKEIAATPANVNLPYRDVRFHSTDGVELHGWYIEGASNRPLILFFHGNSANISHQVENIRSLHSGVGLPIFVFDYRGFGESEGRPLSEDDLYRDARGAIAWLKERGWAPEEMIYYGKSMGASVALQMAIEQPPAGVVLEGSFTSLAEIAWKTSPKLYATLGWWTIDADFNNLNKIDHLRRPVLLFHGFQDTVVPVEMSRRLFARAPDPKRLFLFPDAGHSDIHEVAEDAFHQAWTHFLSEFAGFEAGAKPPPDDKSEASLSQSG